MTIERIENGRQITLAPEGWLDTASAPELGAALEEIREASEIVLDLKKVEYIASAGLRQVVAAHKQAKAMGAAFAVVNAGSKVMSIFKLTGLDKKMNITGA